MLDLVDSEQSVSFEDIEDDEDELFLIRASRAIDVHRRPRRTSYRTLCRGLFLVRICIVIPVMFFCCPLCACEESRDRSTDIF